MRLLAFLFTFLALGAVTAQAAGRETLSLRTSLGPISAQDTRPLRARGEAPTGSRLTVRYYRGSRRLKTKRYRVRDGRYRSAYPIDRTGRYTVRVSARTASGRVLRVTAELDYGPEAEAPSAPDNAPDTAP